MPNAHKAMYEMSYVFRCHNGASCFNRIASQQD